MEWVLLVIFTVAVSFGRLVDGVDVDFIDVFDGPAGYAVVG